MIRFISRTYFLLDAGGAFGNWGQASGFSRETVNRWIARDRAAIQEELCTMDFDINYVKPIEQTRMEMMRENREFARDNTYVNPRAIYSARYHLLHTIAVKIVSFGSILRHKIVSIAKAIHIRISNGGIKTSSAF